MRPILALLGVYCFAAGCSNTPDALSKPEKFCTIVNAEKLRTALKQSHGKVVLINVCPIKQTADKFKQDIELVVSFQDAAGNPLPGNESKTDYEKKIAHFVNYMHFNKVPSAQIPRGYFYRIDSLKAFTSPQFNFCIEPRNAIAWYCNGEEMEGPDSRGNCPPDCCPKLISLAAKRTGRACPPDCDKGNSAYSVYMEKTIASVYGPGKK